MCVFLLIVGVEGRGGKEAGGGGGGEGGCNSSFEELSIC